MLSLALSLLAATPTPEAVFARLECNRCHEIEHVHAAPVNKQCAGCHVELASAAGDATKLEKGRAEYGDAFDRFVRRTATLYVDVPPLAGLSRFRASWLKSYLRNPYDLRPHLTESMPKLPLTDAELDVLARGLKLTPDAPLPKPSRERLAKGQALFEAKTCTTCHLLGNQRFPTQPEALFEFKRPAISLHARAPDLRHARDRLNRDVVVKVLLDPKTVNPRAQMPKLGLSRSEAELLADFVLATPLAEPIDDMFERDISTSGPVRYEDVEARVFKKTCWHCHSNPDLADGDGGPGNTGGFGFKGLGLSFATYEEVMNGSIGPDGEYRSIFRLGTTGVPVLLEVLRRRVHENARDFVKPGLDGRRETLALKEDGPLGMPLGLPALTAEDLALVEAWIAAGKPRPSTPSGLLISPMGRLAPP